MNMIEEEVRHHYPHRLHSSCLRRPRDVPMSVALSPPVPRLLLCLPQGNAVMTGRRTLINPLSHALLILTQTSISQQAILRALQCRQSEVQCSSTAAGATATFNPDERDESLLKRTSVLCPLPALFPSASAASSLAPSTATIAPNVSLLYYSCIFTRSGSCSGNCSGIIRRRHR